MNFTLRKDGRIQGAVQVNGKRKFFYGKTRKEVKHKFDMWNGTENSTNSTVEGAISLWLKKNVSRYSKATQDQYKTMKGYITPIIGTLKVEEVLPVNCQDVLDNAQRKGLSKATIKHIKKVMHVFFEHERKMKKTIRLNPCTDMIIKGKETRPRRAPTSEELDYIWKQLEGTQYQYAYKVLALTGMRPSEICDLKWTDIDEQIHITGARTRLDVSTGKTNFAKRDIPLTNTVKIMLNHQRVFLVNKKIKSDYIFPTRYGSPSDSGLLSHEWSRKKLPVTLYELRHLFVSIAIDKIPIKDLQALIGHSSTMDTTGTYAHVFKDNKNLDILEEINAKLIPSDVKSDVKAKNKEEKREAL